MDHKFWRWGLWFTYNCLWPGKVQQNDAAQQQLGLYSMKCLQNLEVGTYLPNYNFIKLYCLEPIFCKKQQKKVPDQLLVCGIGDL